MKLAPCLTALLLTTCWGVEAATPLVLYETGWEAAPANPFWVPGNVSPQNSWFSAGSNAQRHRVVANGAAEANPFGTPVTTPFGSQFHRFTASSSTTTNNGQYTWPDLSAAFTGRPTGFDRLTGSIDLFVPSGESADGSIYGLFGYDDSPDGNFLDFGFLVAPNTRSILLIIDGAIAANVAAAFPYDTWFNLAIRVDYETGDVSVLLNGTPVAGLADTNPFIVDSSFTDLDLFCQNSLSAPNPRVVYSDNYLVIVGPSVEGPPSNDNLADAFLIEGISGVTNGSSMNATIEPDEPDRGLVPAAASSWYRWIAPISGSFTLDTTGSAIDTVLAVYTGADFISFQEVASNDNIDDILPILQSRVTFIATAGTTYYIAVDGAGGASGSFILHWSIKQPNDNFADALGISGPSGQANGSNIGATSEPQEPAHAGVTATSSLWYRWMAPANGVFIFDTVGSSIDTVMAAYTGDSIDALTEIASNDDLAPGTVQSRITFTAVAGTIYWIAVDGFQGDSGALVLNWHAESSGNTAPTLASISDYVVNVLIPVAFTNMATDPDLPANLLTYSLAPGFPVGAKVNPTNGVFRWTPKRGQASSTNVITVTVTDNGAPPLSDSKSFRVIVNDFVELTLDSTIIQAGQTGSIALTVFTTTAMTNVSAAIDFPPGSLDGWMLESQTPVTGTLAVQLPQSRLLLSCGVPEGQTIMGTQLLARLTFVGATNHNSAFLPLHVSVVNGIRPDASEIPGMLANDGRVVLVADKPLVEALAPPGSERLLILYGKPGRNYTILTTSAVGAPAVWSPLLNTTLTGQSQTNNNLGNAGLIYYQARE